MSRVFAIYIIIEYMNFFQSFYQFPSNDVATNAQHNCNRFSVT